MYKNRVAAYEFQIRDLEQRVNFLHRQNVSESIRAGMISASNRSWPVLGYQGKENGTGLTTAMSADQLIQPFSPRSNYESFKHLGNSFENSAIFDLSANIVCDTQAVSGQEIALPIDVRKGIMVPRGPKVRTAVEYQWLSNFTWVAEAPDTPNALELLYGSRQNRLADAIHHRLGLRACREPERLAYGWLLYLLAKWISEPTEARYIQLPSFLKPIREQIQYEHPGCLDGLIWPRLRANLILRQDCYDMEELAGFLACCMKVRWPWGKNFLEPKDDGAFVVRKDFHDTFTSVEGWGLTSEFMRAYPELMEGIDLGKIHYQVV